MHHAPLFMKVKVGVDGFEAVGTAPLHGMGKDEEGGLSEDCGRLRGMSMLG